MTATESLQPAGAVRDTLGPVSLIAGDRLRLDYRYLVAVDIEGFSRLSANEQAGVQTELDQALSDAARHSGLDRSAWQRQPGGDGELAVLPADADGLRLLADFPRELALALSNINARRYPGPRIRLRLAIHHGTLAPGCFGPVGQAPIVVSRLLDSGILRQELRDRVEDDLVMIISSSLYADVVETQFHGLDPAAFASADIHAKDRVIPAYIHRPKPCPADLGQKSMPSRSMPRRAS